MLDNAPSQKNAMAVDIPNEIPSDIPPSLSKDTPQDGKQQSHSEPPTLQPSSATSAGLPSYNNQYPADSHSHVRYEMCVFLILSSIIHRIGRNILNLECQHFPTLKVHPVFNIYESVFYLLLGELLSKQTTPSRFPHVSNILR